jgi:hypothetical protein
LPHFGLASFPSTDDWASPVTVESAVHGLNAGNLFWALGVLNNDLRAGKALDTALGPLLTRYAWFHGLVTVVCLGLAIGRLRRSALQEAADSARQTAARANVLPRLRLVPLRGWVAAWPLLWKEIIVDIGARPGWLRRLFHGVVVALILWPAVHLANWYGGFVSHERWWEGMREPLNLWTCTVGVLIGGPLLLLVGVRAAGSVSGERARQTLDGLLTTPFEANTIVFAKWLGSLFTARGPWLLLGLVWMLGLLAGAVTAKAIAGFLLVWLVYAGFMSAMGLYFSVVCRSTQRATLLTLLSTILLLALSGLLAFDLSWYGEDSFSLLPPATLWLVPRRPSETPQAHTPSGHGPYFIALGLVLCLALTAGLWLLASYRFRIAIGRPARDKRRTASGAETSESTLTTGAAPPEPATVAMADVARAAPALCAPSAPVKVAIRKTGGEAPLRPPRPRSSWLKRLRPALLLLVPVALVQAWYFLHSAAAERRLQNAIAEADRLDPGWRLEELEAKRDVLPDDRNSAVQVAAVHQLRPRDWPSHLFQERFDIAQVTGEPPCLLPDGDAKLLEDQLKVAATGLETARRLAHMPQGRMAVVWSKDGIGVLLPSLQEAREVANLLGYDAWLRCQKGDIDGALESCRAILNVERAIGDEPTHVSMLVRSAVRGIGVARVERALAQGKASASALAQLQEQMAELENHRFLLIAMRGERALNDRFMRWLQEGGFSPKNLSAMLGLGNTGPGGSLIPEELVALLSSPLPGQRAALLQYNTMLVEIAKLPDHQQDAECAKAISLLPDQPLFVRQFVAAGARMATAHRRALAYLRCMRVGVATERFRLRHERWPKSLAELAQGGLLKEVPEDPCDGLKLRYRLLPDGVVIYSIGPDGQDNGGKLDRKNPNAVGADWGIRLWNVDRRRQAPVNPIYVWPVILFP